MRCPHFLPTTAFFFFTFAACSLRLKQCYQCSPCIDDTAEEEQGAKEKKKEEKEENDREQKKNSSAEKTKSSPLRMPIVKNATKSIQQIENIKNRRNHRNHH